MAEFVIIWQNLFIIFLMTNEQNAIKKYINENKKLQELVLQIIDKDDSENGPFFNDLQNHLRTNQYEGNKSKLKHFLQLILIISMNHHRNPNFFENIKKILTTSSKFYNKIFTNEELFTIFQESKPILLFLIDEKNHYN